MNRSEEVLAFLDSLSEKPLSAKIKSLDAKSLAAVNALVEDILERERAGLDSLFSSMTHTMKFIPNILLQTLTAKYIEAPIAAKITAKLTSRQAVGIANGLKADYVAEASRYMEPHHAAELLANMANRKARASLECLIEISPGKAIDLMQCLGRDNLLRLVEKKSLLALQDKVDAKQVEQLLSLW